MRTWSVHVILCLAVLAGCASQPPGAIPSAKIDRVLTLIQERLGYMDDVARNKWNSGAPIEDLPRERDILDGIVSQAATYGVDPDFARDFFRAQIEASKIIQNTRFHEWRAQQQQPFAGLPDLRVKIRPALDALTPALLEALAAAAPDLATAGAASALETRIAVIVTGHSADAPAREQALAPLRRRALAR